MSAPELRRRRIIAALIVIALYVLHQDVWWWREAHPIVFGLLPIGLFYHVAYTLAAAVVLWGLVRWLWPRDLDAEAALE